MGRFVTEVYVKPPPRDGAGIVERIIYLFATPKPAEWPKRFLVKAPDQRWAITLTRWNLSFRGYHFGEDYSNLRVTPERGGWFEVVAEQKEGK